MKTVVSEKGQVTIPKKLRDRLGIRAGEILEFEEHAGKLVATKARRVSAVDELYGAFRTGRSTDELVNDLRGPAE